VTDLIRITDFQLDEIVEQFITPVKYPKKEVTILSALGISTSIASSSLPSESWPLPDPEP